MPNNNSAKMPSMQRMNEEIISSLKEQVSILTSSLNPALPEDEDGAGIQHSTVSSMPEDEEQKHHKEDCATGSQQGQTKAGNVARNKQRAMSSKAENIMKCIVCGAAPCRKIYGLVVCDACDNFFRRCIRDGKSSEFKCNNEGMCSKNISEQTRKKCQLWRLHKCLDVGMDPDRLSVGKKALTDYVYFVYLGVSPQNVLEQVETTQWQRLDEVLSSALIKICNFAKRMPGFCRLSINDQSLLLEYSFLEVMAILASISYDSATESIITVGGHKLVKSHEKKVYVNSYDVFFENFFQEVERIVSFKLDPKALVLVAGWLIFHISNQEVKEKLQDKDVVEMKQAEFMEAFVGLKPKDSSDDGNHTACSWTGKDPIPELYRLHNTIRDKILKVKGIAKRDTGELLWEMFYENLQLTVERVV